MTWGEEEGVPREDHHMAMSKPRKPAECLDTSFLMKLLNEGCVPLRLLE